MKKLLLTIVFALFATSILMVSCDLIPIDLPGILPPKALTAGEAKVELQAGNQELITQKDEMLQSPGMSALSYFMQFMLGAQKSVRIEEPIFAQRMTYTRFLNYFREGFELKSIVVDDEGMYGIFEYNFDTSTFDFVEESTSILKFSYPADEIAMNNKVNNAAITISNLQFAEIESSYETLDWETGEYVTETTMESIPVGAVVDLTVDGNSELEASYSGAFTSDGMPTSISFDMKSGEYEMDMSFSGSGTVYNSDFKFESEDGIIAASDMKTTYTSDMETVSLIEGYMMAGGIKFDGSVQAENLANIMMEYEETEVEPDLAVLNTYLDVEVIDDEQNALIGHLEFFNYYDAEWEETYPVIAIVYEDGTYDWLDDVFTIADDIAL